MRTEHQCLAKAADMERRAQECDTPEVSADFLHMAQCWRRVARRAAWQDLFRKRLISTGAAVRPAT